MSNQKIIEGKTTPQRLNEELEKLTASTECVTVQEFARRSGIAYATLTHRYRSYAEEVRRMRDARRRTTYKRSPATLRHEEVSGWREAQKLVAELRGENIRLQGRLNATSAALEKAQKRLLRLPQREEENEQLRGVLAAVYNRIGQYCEPDVAQSILIVVETGADETGLDD